MRQDYILLDAGAREDSRIAHSAVGGNGAASMPRERTNVMRRVLRLD